MFSTRDRFDRRMNPRLARGFTLPELMVTITIAAILLAIGIPSFRSVTTSNRIASEVNGLLGDMQFARLEAIKEGQTVTVCSSTDGTSCSGSTSWATGWIVFDDTNGNKVVNANDPVLRTQAAFNGGDTFDADNNVSGVVFNREGFALGLPGTVTLTLHESSGSTTRGRCLAITRVGMLATQHNGQPGCT